NQVLVPGCRSFSYAPHSQRVRCQILDDLARDDPLAEPHDLLRGFLNAELRLARLVGHLSARNLRDELIESIWFKRIRLQSPRVVPRDGAQFVGDMLVQRPFLDSLLLSVGDRPLSDRGLKLLEKESSEIVAPRIVELYVVGDPDAPHNLRLDHNH